MSFIFQWILFEAVLPRKEEREIPQCNFITARTCAQSFRQIIVLVHVPVLNVFDSVGPGFAVGEKGKKRGQIGKISTSEPFPFLRIHLSARFTRHIFFSPDPQPPMRSLVPGYVFYRDHLLGNKNVKSKDYYKAGSEHRVLFFHNNISDGHTSLLQVNRCYCSSTVLVQVYRCYLGHTIIYRQS